MVQVEVARVSDFGRNDRTFIINTHLGETLNYNDTVLGYDLDAINLMQLEDMEFNQELQVPPIVLVKKTFPKYRKRRKHRLWKLKHLPKEDAPDEGDGEVAPNKGKKKGKDNTSQRYEKDYQMFL
jgi:nonsense-mediated mRNA decay protein 3